MRVVVAEKPSVARDLARVLAPGATPGEGMVRGGDLVFTWALGHLLELAPPEAYDPALRRWRLESLPILPERFALRPRAAGKAGGAGAGRGGPGRGRSGSPAAQLERIRRLLAQRSVDEVVNACDAGREGERIFREILAVCPTSARLSRLWLSETTPAAVRRAWEERRPLAEFDALAAAADARAEADWVVGMNATRALTVRHQPSGRGLLTAGRVQTPTLALLTVREEAIRAFRPEPYHTVEATFALAAGDRYRATWIGRHDAPPALWTSRRGTAGPDGEGEAGGPAEGEAAGRRLRERGEAEAVAGRLRGRDGVLHAVATRERREPPPLLFNLNDLQRAANRTLGLTARQTLEVAQRLYESGLLSYPRTDSRHLTPELAATVPARLRAAMMPAPAVEPGRAPCVARAKVTDHYGLLPTERAPGAAVAGRERAVWQLVARRAAAAFQEAALWSEGRALTVVDRDWLVSEGRALVRPGWRAVEPPDSAGANARGRPAGEAGPADGALPAALLGAAAGAPVRCLEARVLDHTTRAPARYTDASLLRVMERAGHGLEERALRQAMAGAGLGTAATRAEILESLVRRGYVQREGRSLRPTEAGEALVRAAPPALRSAELTARWEERLSAIEGGRDDPARFGAAIAELAHAVVAAVRSGPLLEPPPAVGPGERTAPRRGSPPPRPGGSRRRPDAVRPDRATAGRAGPLVCPRCGATMARTAQAYACEGSCQARVARRYEGRATLWSDVEALLRRGRTPLRRGFAGPAAGAGRLVLGADGAISVVRQSGAAARAGAPAAHAGPPAARPRRQRSAGRRRPRADGREALR